MHKYTSDGKKVAVIGKLNATETIVQEIFVRPDASEIPSGEQFVTKSLHDSPVVSWQEKRVKEIAQRLAEMDKELSRRIDEQRKQMALAAIRIQGLKQVATVATRASLDTLEDFVSGRITHVVEFKYGCQIIPFDKAITPSREFGYYDEWLKLLSLFGKSDGTLCWRIHQYYDGSGMSTEILPATSYQHAVDIVQGLFDAKVTAWRGDPTNNHPPAIQFAMDYENKPIAVNVPEDVRVYWAAEKANAKAKRIAQLEADLAKAKAE